MEKSNVLRFKKVITQINSKQNNISYADALQSTANLSNCKQEVPFIVKKINI